VNNTAMKVLGVFVRIQNGAYVAGFAVVEGETLVHEERFVAPPDEDLSRQLAELYTHARDIINHYDVAAVALKESEIRGGTREASTARRAEGAILSAAGTTRELPVSAWLGASMSRHAGFTKRPSNAEVISTLAATVQPRPASDDTQQATAAARAAILSTT
jgi:Holliday junction resolvasome RuvABC endonuclease subunit